MILRVKLNGTDINPFYKMYGVKQNPFPQIADYKYAAQCIHLQKLGATPIIRVQEIRDHLKGWSKEFVDLCCSKFVPGQMVEFTVKFED
jgi:hypothetical protein